MTSTARTTSAYSLRVACTPAEADDLLATLVRVTVTDRPVTDQHTCKTDPDQPYVSVGFRAAGDYEAECLSTLVLTQARQSDRATCLLTGHGIHRRIVTE